MDDLTALMAAYAEQRADPALGPIYGEPGEGLILTLRDIDEYDDGDPRVLTFYLSILTDESDEPLARREVLHLLKDRRYTAEQHVAVGRALATVAASGRSNLVRHDALLVAAGFLDVPDLVAALEGIVADAAEPVSLRESALWHLHHRGQPRSD